MRKRRFLKRWRVLGSIMLVFSGPCLPDNFASNLVANSVSAVTGVLLSDFLNVVIPPVA